ncbi:N-6 DNA methylase [Polaribacter litorisediminis]|uniref:Eco57I restriction-modification methylase domain-containing protein n=1 Tax=Polaribacter litorisediminis TaxID=1908341 RepID=UPI001CBEB2DA|nr:DNA methyltransferase [Polaribacter litorisediminis]UAM98011.1 N-6 DNA methylase [Polaribacter litorisediminis]
MNFSSINIQGNILSSEILDKIRSEEKFKHQQPEAFGLARTASLRDEIGMSWAIMRTHWQAYKKRLETLPKGDTGTSLTRERLIIPLLSELGFEVSRQKAQLVNGKSYAISHGATNKDHYPIHIMGYNDHLDKRRDVGGPRLSPHALVQEYLNNTEHLYALVTNGKQLRLLRDATRLVRMSYVEFDLERMFEEELYADFSLLFRVLHATRMPDKIDGGSESVIEYYHQESMASGTRIREKLSEAVENSIKTLANGFLEHLSNTELIQLFETNSISADQYYTQQLSLIYRILFLIVLEERKLIYPDDLTEEQQRFRKVYYRYYSIERLRKLTENRVYVDADKYDLWESLKTTFLIFEHEEYGAKLGIKPLGSGLFASNAIGILKEQFLSNGNLIEVLKRLTTFVNEQKVLVRVNYSDLDVEEFGSIYEGLLDYKPVVQNIGSQFQFSFIPGDDRSSSGSHYTPEELVKPLIKHSLEYIIADKLKESNPEEALLSITVCDVACGSGHILLSAARKIATELASIREGAEQPSPTYYRAAMKDVIRNCIYGVDLNPLAVELCKVALWLEAHNPNEPLNFLDHHIKCGNAIVGLAHFEELQNGIATEAFKTLPGDDKEFAATLRKKNTAERKTKQISTFDTEKEDVNLQGIQKEFATFVALPESSPEEIAAKAEAYKNLTTDKKWYRLKNLADLQVAQFFIPKTVENREKLTTNEKYKTYLNSGAQIIDRGAANAMAVKKRFFHWFLEFPQVFSNGGFDCILGNPPFLGGQKLSGTYGYPFTEFIKYEYTPIGSVDLVTYFFRRIFQIIKKGGFQSLISTNTIAQGNARTDGLVIIKEKGGAINYAVKSMKWPGLAAVEVALVTIFKGKWIKTLVLDQKKVEYITTYLDNQEFLGEPYSLVSNTNKSFQGSIILGKGFVIEKEKANRIINSNSKYKNVLYPFLNGQDLNNTIDQKAKRWVINFFDWKKEKAEKYEQCFDMVEDTVLKERIASNRKKENDGKTLNNDDIKKVDDFWNYLRPRIELYKLLKSKNEALVIARISKTVAFEIVEANQVFADALVVFPEFGKTHLGCLQSSLHVHWAWKYCTTMKADLNYSPGKTFETFPFPNDFSNLEELVTSYISKRKALCLNYNIGLTGLNGLFNDSKNKEDGIVELRKIYKEMDNVVLAAYGWQDINLLHDFYEVDYLPENDRVRYTVHPDARKEVLKRLLLLNHERYEDEVKQGLHKKKDVVAFYKQKNQEVPEDITFSDGKKKPVKRKKVTALEEPKEQYGLFNDVAKEIKENRKLTIKNEEGVIFKYHITQKATKGNFTGAFKQIATDSTLAEIMLGRKVGDSFNFGGVGYVILEVE